MNNSFLSSLTDNLKSFYLQECTFDMFNKDQSIAQLFLPICKHEDLSSFLKEIINQLPVNDETLDIRWAIQSIVLILNEKFENDMSSELAMKDFSSFNDQTMNVLKKYINFEGEINNGTAHDLSFYIQLLRDDYPGIFYSILPNLQYIISKIRSDRIYKAIGSNFITFCISPPIDFFNQIKEFDEQELPSFFQFHTNFTQPELTSSLETKISTLFPYPSSIKGIENSINFTLANSSLCKNQPFIDIVYELVDKELASQANSKIIQNLIEPVLDFFPYLIVANQSILLREKNQYLQKLLKIFDTNTQPSQNIKYFLNDFKFLNFISNQAGKKYGYGDLFIDSFPFLLKSVLQKTDEILNFSKFKLLSIKDNQRDNDFNFTRCFGVFYQILSFIKNNAQNPNQAQLGNILNIITKLLKDISNEKIKSKVVIDLFSCVFIEDKTHQFACHPLIAQQIISTLIKFQVPIQIYRANALFENKKPTKSDLSILPWLNNGTQFIYSAIENKNWPLASKLTAFLPYHIKFYSEAMQADKFISENDEHVDKYVKVNVLLSTKTEKDKLTECQNGKKLFELMDAIIDNRIQKFLDPEVLCYAIENMNIFQPIIDFSVEFDEHFEKSLKKIKNFPQNHYITNPCKKLDEFLNYLYKYYRCAILIDSTTFDSIEDLFKFDFQKAIEGSILHDQMKGAEELAKCVNVNLFKHVFENLSSFGINFNFIENLAEKFPLEATALAISNHIKANLPPKMKSISDYFIFLEKLKSQRNTTEEINYDDNDEEKVSIESILNPDFNGNEDLLFLVDHDELYNEMMHKFDNETIATKFYKVFCFVSYVAPESDQIRLKSIEAFYHVLHISDKKDPFGIVNDLYEKGEQYFQLIIDYITYWVSPFEQTSLILKLLNLSFKNESQIDLILQTFTDHFDVIMTRHYYYEGFLAHLIKNAPSCKVKFLNTISLLPEPVFNDCNVFDIDSIAHSYVRYPTKIIEMPKQVADYFSDEHLFTILKGTINSQYSNQIFYHLYQFFSDKNRMIDFWSDIIDCNLKKMVIDSESKEIVITKFFNQLKEPLNTINHTKFKQFKSLSHLVDLKPFMHYQINYSFQNLREPDFIDDILYVCGKMDDKNIIFDISESFGIELDSFYFSRAHLQLILGDFMGAVETIQQEFLKINNYCHPRFYDSTYNFIYPLSKTPIFHHNKKKDDDEDKNNSKSEIPFTNLYLESSQIPDDVFKSASVFLNGIPKGIKKKVTKFSSPEAKNTLNKLISEHCSIGPALSLFISFHQFEKAIDILNTVENREEKIDLFIHNVILPVVFNNLDSMFMDFIMKTDGNLEKTGFLWDAAIDFFKKKNMLQGLILALQVENKLEDAAIVGFESLKSCVSFFEEVTILGNIIINLKTSINFRRSNYKPKENPENLENNEQDETTNTIHKSPSITEPIQLSNVIINESKSYDEINEYLNIAELQLSVSKFCIEKSIPFTHDYEIFSSEKDAESVAALLFINKQYDLMKEIKDTMKLCRTDILCKASELICKESPERVIKFIRKLSNEDRLDFLKALAMNNNRQIFFSVMYDCFGKEEQLCLFLDYNFIVDSFALAYASKNKDLIPLIAHKAALLGDTRTVHECEKILNQA